jgi:hypothetical protein
LAEGEIRRGGHADEIVRAGRNRRRRGSDGQTNEQAWKAVARGGHG